MAKAAIVTGSSRGIGAAFARRLGKMGYNVAINYVSDSSKSSAEQLATEITNEHNVRSLVFQGDVSKYEVCKDFINTTVEHFGNQVDVLVNNAGIASGASFIGADPSEYTRVIETNLMSAFHMSSISLAYMVDRDDACIINTSSVGGLKPVNDAEAYCASKAGIIGLTRALALDLAKRKVRVNAIAPGMIMTDILGDVDTEAIDAISQTIPMGCVGDVSDIAGALEYILGARYLTGQTISPNGGFVMMP